MWRSKRAGLTVVIIALAAILLFVCAAAFWMFTTPCPAPNVEIKGPVEFHIYESGQIVESGSIPQGSPLIDLIGHEMADKDKVWRKTIVSRVPGVKINGHGFSVIFQENIMSLTYLHGDEEWSGVTTEIRPGLYHEIRSRIDGLRVD